MKPVLFRVDDRLIHGQIIAAWVPFMRATRIIVADDHLPHNEMLSKILRLAVPTNLRVEIISVRQAVALVEQQRSGPGLVTIMLFASLAAVVQAVADGLSLIELNVGNIRNSTGKLQLVDSVSLDSQDIESLRKLRSHDIRITIQPVPTAPAIDIVDLLQYKGLW